MNEKSQKRAEEIIARGRENGRVLHVSEAFTKHPVQNEFHGGSIDYFKENSDYFTESKDDTNRLLRDSHVKCDYLYTGIKADDIIMVVGSVTQEQYDKFMDVYESLFEQ